MDERGRGGEREERGERRERQAGKGTSGPGTCYLIPQTGPQFTLLFWISLFCLKPSPDPPWIPVAEADPSLLGDSQVPASQVSAPKKSSSIPPQPGASPSQNCSGPICLFLLCTSFSPGVGSCIFSSVCTWIGSLKKLTSALLNPARGQVRGCG